MKEISSYRLSALIVCEYTAEYHSIVSAQREADVQVWASKWSERAWLSRRARGVKEGDLYMAVLLQQVSFHDAAHVFPWNFHA